MNDFVRFGVILHHISTVVGWVFCLVLLGQPEARSMVGFVLLLGWTFLQTIAVLELVARLLLGRLDEKQQRMQRLDETVRGLLDARRAFAVEAMVFALMVAAKIALPAGLNRI